MEASSTLVAILGARARGTPDRWVYRFLDSEGEEADSRTFSELDRRARALAGRIRQAARPGDRALLLFPPGLDFVDAFFACLHAGVVAVPAYPPRSRRTLPRLDAIARDAGPRLLLTSPSLRPRVEAWARGHWQLERPVLLNTAGLTEAEDGEAPVDPAAADLAFLQYTSGSTAAPKGVKVSHSNLMHNEGLIQTAFGMTERSTVVSWLPMYHDMGLIGSLLQPLYCGGRAVLMSPMAFLQRPLRWLRAIERHRADTSGGPNFAYELCAEKIRPAERRALDLSSWRVAFNGSEPVRGETLERFASAFHAACFDRRAFLPCYGLAEATLLVAGGRR